ncbi:MAG: dihydroxyacetone kinase subunit L [Chloroflexaceae bacterium]|nr:dihydroxyacetone kinase subunit L [Chloroflexaceae bacterium]
MSNAQSLVALFEAMTQNLERDRDNLNQLDRDDNDTGDNMVANFRLVTATLQQEINREGETDLGVALGQAAQTLRSEGRGGTAGIYADGLAEAANRLSGKSSFTLDDLLPLLEGLARGAQQSGRQPGEGSLLDVLLPAIGSYSQAKRAGQSDLEAMLSALLEARRGATGTASASTGYGRGAGRDTRGEIDPGAAGAASLLEGLLGALLQSAMRGQAGGAGAPGKYSGPSTLPQTETGTGETRPQAPASSGNPILDILGGLFGGNR